MAASRSSKARTKYAWAPGARKPAKAAALVGAAVERVKTRAGRVTAKALVDDARPANSPTHALYEWDDTKAAESYREEQAREYLRALVVTIESPKGPQTIRAAVSFGSGESYVTTERALSSTELRSRLVGQALAEAESWRRRYEHLRELASVFAAIQKAAEKLKH